MNIVVTADEPSHSSEATNTINPGGGKPIYMDSVTTTPGPPMYHEVFPSGGGELPQQTVYDNPGFVHGLPDDLPPPPSYYTVVSYLLSIN